MKKGYGREMEESIMKYSMAYCLKISLITLSICLFGGVVKAQILGDNFNSSLSSQNNAPNMLRIEKGMNLKQALGLLEQRYGVVFLYRTDAVSNQKITSTKTLPNDLKKSLNEILKGQGLKYRYLNPLTYAIYAQHESSRSVEPLKSVIRQFQVQGKVTDATTGEALPGVNVLLKGSSSIGTATDPNGQYQLTVPQASDTLVFSYIGYARQEVPIMGKSTINVALRQQAISGQELVVVGYGTQKRATLTGSISDIKGTDVLKSPAVNVSNNLVGRLPGVTAVQQSGEPGYDVSAIRIRGVNTFGTNSDANNALVVVDGVPGRSLQRIDPSSIQSITVLKDASAAIYGSEAANGVILITTKRGQAGKPRVSLNLNYGFNQPTRFPKMADAATYASMLNEIATYAGNPLPYTSEDIQKFKNGSDPWGHPNTDWFKAVMKPWSPQYKMDVSISGGTKAMRYYVLLGTNYEDGNYRNSATYYRQTNFRANLDGQINKDIHVGFDVAGREEYRHFPTRSAYDIFRYLMESKPTMPAFWPNGLPGPDLEYGNNPAVIVTSATGYNRDKWYYLNSNLHLDINIPWVQGLSLSGNAAFDKGLQDQKVWDTPWYLYTLQGFDANGNPNLVKGSRGYAYPQLTQYSQDNTTITLNALLNYEHSFGTDHQVKFMVATESIQGDGSSFNAFRRFSSPAIDQLFAGLSDTQLNNGGTGTISRRLNYFGRVNYSFRDKYLAEFVWRYDGSYIFPAGKRFGFFPGVSLGWRISQENFWKKNISFINEFKLRGSWGRTGNDRINEWQYLSTYNLGNFLNLPYYPFVTNGNVENQTLYEARVPNPNVTWEDADQKDVGFDATLLDNRLSITADYFSYLRTNILWYRNASVPQSTGLSLPRENIGKAGNRGFDFSVNYQDHAGQFHYQFGVNGGYARNRVINWDEPPGAPVYQQTTGHPFPSSGLYYVAIGVYHNQQEIDNSPHWVNARPGDIIFKDVNGDGKIDGNDRVRSYLNNIPRFTGGLTGQFQYKGFDLSFLVQGAAGAENYVFTLSGQSGNFLESYAQGRWTPTNTSANKPRTYDRDNEYWASNRNTFFLYNTDYVRLKSLELGYSLPQSVLDRMGIQKLRIFVSGYNLLTYSPSYKDFDPEASSGNLGAGATYDGTTYPPQRVVNTGVSITF